MLTLETIQHECAVGVFPVFPEVCYPLAGRLGDTFVHLSERGALSHSLKKLPGMQEIL